MTSANKTTVIDVKDPPYGPGHLYCATSSADGVWLGGGTYGTLSLFFTRDGARFEKRTAPELYQHRSLLALPDGTLLAGGQYGLQRSKDGGKKWNNVPSFAKKGGPVQCWQLARCEDGTIWGGSDGVIAWSKDGVKWSHLTVPKSGGFDWLFAAGDRVFALFEKNLFVVRNGKLEARKAMPKAVWGMARAPNGTMLVVGDGGLVMRSEDGLRWQPSKSPAKSKLAAVAWCTDRFIITGEDGALLSTVDGKTFTKLTGASGIEGCSVTPFGTGALIGGIRNDKGVVLRIGEPAKAAKAGKGAKTQAAATKPMPARKTRVRIAASVKKSRVGLADVERTTMATVGKEFGLARKVNFDLSPSDLILVYRGDLVVDRFEAPANAKVVVVDGHLVIEGGLDLSVHEDDDAYLLLLVTGDVSARSAWISGDPLVQIAGNAEFEDVVVIGQGHSLVEVKGTLSARALFVLAQGNVRAKKIDALIVGDKTRFGKGQSAIAYGTESAASVLQDKYVGDDGSAAMDALRAPLKKGTEVLRKELGA